VSLHFSGLFQNLYHFPQYLDRRNDLSPFGERAGIGAVMAGIGADER